MFVGLIFSGTNPLEFVGLGGIPAIENGWNFIQQYKIIAAALAYIGIATIEASMQASGAFEVYLNGW